MTPLGVETDEVDDVELGAVLFSKTHFNGEWPRGGVIVRVNRDEDLDQVLGVEVVDKWTHGHPQTFVIVADDIDLETARWFTKDALGLSERISDFLSNKRTRPADARNRAYWARIAADLAEAGATGLYLPRAEARYQRNRHLRSTAS
jgi:hypothetical protein